MNKRIAIFSHIRPDGDTLGAMFALRRVCQNRGVIADCYCDDLMPDDLSFLDPDNSLNAVQDISKYDVAIAVDCADDDRMGRYKSLFYAAKTTYNIDHHMTNTNYATHNYVFDSASTCEIVYDLLIKEGIEIDTGIALSLYTGVMTDTGSFSQSNTTSHSFATASALVVYGVDIEWLNDRLFKEQNKRKMLLIADCIASMRFYRDDQIALIVVTKALLDKHGLTPADSDGLVNYARNISGVKIAACMTEYGTENFKVSLRCKLGYDVSAVALHFGGGGHVQAAGCAVKALCEEVVERVVRQCEIALDLAQ